MLTTQLLILTLVLVVIFYVALWPRLRRARIQARPFPTPWLETLRRRLPFFDALPQPLQDQLQNLIKEFIHDKRFIGCAGQRIDDEIRVTVAAQACLLLLNRQSGRYRDLRSILVYPSTFVARREVMDDLGLVSTHHSELLGESWSQGKVVLAWDSVEKGIMNLHDGENVVLHEFAHQLDQESGSSNGVPVLGSGADYSTWSRVFNKEFEKLQQAGELLGANGHHRHRADGATGPLTGDEAQEGYQNVLDYYGATDPAEFFAVATEAFFERPGELKKRHPALFEELRAYYCVDPREWRVQAHTTLH